MAEITAALVKQLREMTGAGMMECKKALVESGGDIDGAVDVLRKRGEATAVKKSGRATNEGVVASFICPNHGNASLVEVNCETDFVSGTDKYKDFAKTIAKAVTKGNPASVDDLMGMDCEGQTVQEALTNAIHIFGENMVISRFARISQEGTGAILDYIHMGGKIGVLVQFAFSKPETADNEAFITAGRDVCMQVAAASPVSVDRDSVDPAIIEHEKSIYKAQAEESGKPEAIQEKIATGRLEKFYKENCLVEQEFVKDGEKTVKQYLAEASKACGDEISVVTFRRFVLGEAISE